MGRAGQLDEAQRAEIGEAVLKARGQGVGWKTLERIYGRGKVTLWRYAQEAKMKHISAKMKHLGCSETA